MRDLWFNLSVAAQELLVLAAIAVPAGILGWWVLRGLSPWPLAIAIMRRFRWQVMTIVLLVAVSVGLGIGLVAQERGLRAATAQAADKFDLIVGAPGSEMTLLLASVFLQPSDVPLVDGPTYARIAALEGVTLAAPLGFGDSVGDAPVVGTIADFVHHLAEDGITGRMWEDRDEAIVGALTPHQIGDSLTPAHGIGHAADLEPHAGATLDVVGRMAPTGTPWDRAVLVPIESVWSVHGLIGDHHDHDHATEAQPHTGHAHDDHAEHDRADFHEEHDHNHDDHGHDSYTDHDHHSHAEDEDLEAAPRRLGPPFDPDRFPGTPAVILAADGFAETYAVRAAVQDIDDTMAFFPGTILAQLHTVMGDVRRAMSAMSVVTQALVAVSVLLCLLLMIRLVRRQLALLRALGAPARFVVGLVWSLTASLLVFGAGSGLVLGYGAAVILSDVLTERTDLAIAAGLGWAEIRLVTAFASASCFAALLPALFALRERITEGLRG